MKRTMRALRMQVFVGADDMWHHRPVYHEIITRARRAGLAGATALQGCEGYGASARVHTSRLLDLAEDLPVSVVIVDRAERIRAFLPELDDLVEEGAVLLDEVEVIRYTREGGR
ncbi:DUF190 domain-containing protein [Salinifilum aidingensis]